MNSEEFIKENSRPIRFETYQGIYYLLKDGVIVYVGQSVNVMARIAVHVQAGEKEFDSYFSCPVKKELLNEYEAIEIIRYKPKYNDKLPDNPYYKEIGHFKTKFKLTIPTLKRIFKNKNIEGIFVTKRYYYPVQECYKAIKNSK